VSTAGPPRRWHPRWRFQASARADVTLLPLKRKRRRLVGAVVTSLALAALFGWVLESTWRRHGPFIAANATLEPAFMALPLVLMLRLWILAPERILMDAEGFTLIRRRRRRHARWHEIADIVAHDGRYETASRVRMAGICIRLKTPSGVPLPWVDLPDIYRLGRDQLSGLSGWTRACGSRSRLRRSASKPRRPPSASGTTTCCASRRC
jgi:hypothetical protein